MPAVCSAIGSSKFSELAGAALRHRAGPTNGANVYFTFDLNAGSAPYERSLPPRKAASEAARAPERTELDIDGGIVLVSCVKSKLNHPAPACELYNSSWFTMVRRIVEVSGSRWFILSALYGLVEPSERIAPYDFTLNTLSVAERKAWARKVLDRLIPETAGRSRVVIFAGVRYREFLIEPLRQRGLAVAAPMAHLRRGQQLSWLSRHQ